MVDALKPPQVVPCAHCHGLGHVTVPAEVETVETYYFGCYRESGHYLHDRSWRAGFSEFEKKLPEQMRRGRLDSGYCPGYIEGKPYNRSRAEADGEAALHHVEGWTVLAWWDRSVDRRGASNSALIAKGTWGFTEMITIGKAQYPSVMTRQTRPIVLVEDKTGTPR